MEEAKPSNDVISFNVISNNIKRKNFISIKMEYGRKPKNWNSLKLPNGGWSVIVEQLAETSDSKVLNVVVDALLESATHPNNETDCLDGATIDCLVNLLRSEPPRSILTENAVISLLTNMLYDCGVLPDAMGHKIILLIVDRLKELTNTHAFQGIVKYYTVDLALLVNVLNTNNHLYSFGVDQQLVPLIERIMEETLNSAAGKCGNNTLYKLFVYIVVGFAKNGPECINVILFEFIADILMNCKRPELIDEILEVFIGHKAQGGLCEMMVQKAVCDFFVGLINGITPTDSDRSSAIRKTCGIVLAVLTNDTCTSILFGNGNGKRVNEFLAYLASKSSPLVYATSGLVVGTFATNNNSQSVTLGDRGVTDMPIGKPKSS